MDLSTSIPKDASDPSEEDTSVSFPNQEEDSETAALAKVTADPIANLKADFASQKADFKRIPHHFKTQLHLTNTATQRERQPHNKTYT